MPHYWLIYTLISLYVTAPFVRVMVQNLKDSQITVLFFLILIEEALTTYLLLTGVHIGFAMNLASWEGVFILGYILTSRRTKLIERFVLVLELYLLLLYQWFGFFTALLGSMSVTRHL